MKWLYNRQYMKNDDKGINGHRITLLSLFHFAILFSSHKGEHISFGFGIGPLELALQCSYWIKKNKPIIWDGRHVGKS
jgi:hypothetical protein